MRQLQDQTVTGQLKETFSGALHKTYDDINGHGENHPLDDEVKVELREEFATHLTLAMTELFPDYKFWLKLSDPPSPSQMAAYINSQPSSSPTSPLLTPATTASGYDPENGSMVSSPLLTPVTSHSEDPGWP